jgi:hypothetical protein
MKNKTENDYLVGMTIPKICEKYNINQTNVYNYLKKNNIKPNRQIKDPELHANFSSGSMAADSDHIL